jgi:hypothetical protein
MDHLQKRQRRQLNTTDVIIAIIDPNLFERQRSLPNPYSASVVSAPPPPASATKPVIQL